MITTTREYIEVLTSALSQQTGVKIVEGKGWRVNLHKKELEYRAADLVDMEPVSVRGLLLHELGHVNYTSSANHPTDMEKKYGGQVHEIYNVFEDMRIEKVTKQQYGEYATTALNACNANAMNGIINRKSLTNLPKLSQLMYVALFMHEARFNPDIAARYSSPGYIANDIQLDKEVTERAIKYSNEIRNASYNCMYAPTTEEMKAIVDSDIIPLVEDWLKQDKDKPQPQEVSLKQKGIRPQAKEVVPERMPERESAALLAPYINTLAARLIDILKELRQTMFRGQHKQGKLLSRNVYKVVTDEPRLFSRKTTPDAPDYCFHVLLDKSGSMKKKRTINAALAAVLVNGVAKKMGFPCKLYQFNNYVDQIPNIDAYQEVGGGTSDISALQALKIDHDRRNLVILITDGEMELAYNSERREIIAFLKEKRDTHVVPIGIGHDIHEDTFRMAYPEAIIVPNVEKLPQEMIRVLRAAIHR